MKAATTGYPPADADSVERRAYVAGWHWGLFCGWVLGMLAGSALVGTCLALGNLLGPA